MHSTHHKNHHRGIVALQQKAAVMTLERLHLTVRLRMKCCAAFFIFHLRLVDHQGLISWIKGCLWEIICMHYAPFCPFGMGVWIIYLRRQLWKFSTWYLYWYFCSWQYFKDSYQKKLQIQPMNFILQNVLLKSFTTFSHLTFSIFVHFLEKMAFKVVLSLNSLLDYAEFSLFCWKIYFSRIFSQIYLQK